MKNNNTAKLILTFIVSVVALMGCGNSNSNSPEPLNIAFVLGIADNETKFKDSIPEFANLSSIPNSTYAFISTEGEPTVIQEGKIPDFSAQGYNETMLNRVYNQIKVDLNESIASYQPASAEIDMASSIELAVRAVNAKATVEDNYIVFYSSGRSTIGGINMVETPIYTMDVKASAAAIAKQINVNMSNNINIIWYCYGEIGNNDMQKKFSSSEKTKLKEFYETLFTTLGAKSITFKDELPSAESYQFPETPVSSIPTEGAKSGLTPLEDLLDIDVAALESPIVISEEQISYKPDSVEFLDSDLAKNAIEPIAKFLENHPEKNILLYSTCAGDEDTEYSLWLSRERSETLKQAILEVATIDENRITVVTIKTSDDPYYQFGLGTGAEAAVNRKTVILDVSTELAKQILANAI